METSLTEATAADAVEQTVRTLGEYPGGFETRGVVICGGGARYFPSAWVCVHMLRHLGCRLPIELWHLGSHEMTQQMCDLIRPLGVDFVDASVLRQQSGRRNLTGWELKPFALLNCRFREVLLLDADNFPVVDPAFLFDTPEYRRCGAIFWPDYWQLAPDRPIWRLTGVVHRREPEFESGQIVVDKARCWKPLLLAMWMNEHSDFWYRYVYGDKETFHMAWRRLGWDYAMTGHGVGTLSDMVMCQHDFSGHRIFQHRHLAKWRLTPPNPQIRDFWMEEVGFTALLDLRNRWTERLPVAYSSRTASDRERSAAQELCSRTWAYHRVGHDVRPMAFAIDGTLRTGAAALERTWNIAEREGTVELSIWGEDHRTCTVFPAGPTRWEGRWEVYECMPVELLAAGEDAEKSRRTALVAESNPRCVTDINRLTSVGAVKAALSLPPHGVRWPNGSHRWINVQQAHIEAMREVDFPPYAGGSGRGIVMCGGGKYFTSAYVTIRVLRHVGCQLPIQLWFLGSKGERKPWMVGALSPFDVEWTDGDEVARGLKAAPRILNGWELKAFAVLRAKFEEVLFLDADSYPVRNPTYFFNEPGYAKTGAIFFPDDEPFDLHYCSPDLDVWNALGMEKRIEPAFESGQFLVNRKKCWEELYLAWWMNDHSDYYYRLFNGDKETFHLAWRYRNRDYAMPQRRWVSESPAIIQHDFAGKRAFVHRCRRKWMMPFETDRSFNSPQDGLDNASLEHEAFCQAAVHQLQRSCFPSSAS